MMKTVMNAAVLCLMLVAMTGCGGDSHESVANEAMDAMEEMVEIINTTENVEDVKSKMESLNRKMVDIGNRVKELPKQTPE